MIIILIIVAILVIFAIATYNSLVRNEEMVANSMAQIAAQVESRWDALRNLMDATKHYSNFELEAFEKITQNRSAINKKSSPSDVEEDDQAFAGAMRSFYAVAENYPDLKSSELYKDTMASINKYEDNVRHSRMIYNDTVTKFNRSIKTFPQNLFAGMLGFSEKEYFANDQTKVDAPRFSD
ncbi:MAG: LemA family protein [Peptoniphilaceae bacterium]|nr:LemA family protein [Peptoniphilaceae bacterium]MDY6019311.1 LemA family protein [Anaerococcus sp.]